ncbi:MAG: vitamin K epoxide reductase family protein [Patescibacteria group bacterium]
MKLKTTFFIILAIAATGVLFSGYLSYNSLLADGCDDAIVSCGVEPIEIFGLPTCVYGLAMFAVVAVLAAIGIPKERALGLLRAVLILSVAGVLFAGFLTYYELFVQDAQEFPACGYGLILYVGILIVTLVGNRSNHNAVES